MPKGKKYLIWVLVLAVGFLALVFPLFFKKKKTTFVTETAKRGTVAKIVSATGQLFANQEIRLNFETTGRVKEIKTFVGADLAQGEVVAILDDSNLNFELERARLAYEKALADSGSNDDAVREAKEAVAGAEAYLKEVESLEKQKVQAAESDYQNAKDYYDDALSYYNQVKIDSGENSSAAKSAKLTLTTAQSNKNKAAENLELAKKTKEVNVIYAENSLRTNKEKLKTIQSNFAERSRDASVATAKNAYELANSNLEKSALKTPVAGTITQLNYKKGEVIGSSNLADSFGKMISKDFILESNIAEADIAEVKLDQMAEVSFDALSADEVFQAKVIEIDPASTVIQDVVYYKVKFRLENFDQRLKEGMSADIDIKIQQRDDVIFIPTRAVSKKMGKKTVKILNAKGLATEVEVTTGIESDEGTVEIVSGLNEGDQVIVSEDDGN